VTANRRVTAGSDRKSTRLLLEIFLQPGGFKGLA
jgi:hypothetical protein